MTYTADTRRFEELRCSDSCGWKFKGEFFMRALNTVFDTLRVSVSDGVGINNSQCAINVNMISLHYFMPKTCILLIWISWFFS